ncbi:MAG: hypothetical protein WBD31_02605 [Rubripirellula sp.]
MERSNIKCMTHYDIRGFHLLGDDGMPFVTVEALRRNGNEDPLYIDVYVDLDKDENERHPTLRELEELKPYVVSAVTDTRQRVGDLPVRVYKRCGNGKTEPIANWID